MPAGLYTFIVPCRYRQAVEAREISMDALFTTNLSIFSFFLQKARNLKYFFDSFENKQHEHAVVKTNCQNNILFPIESTFDMRDNARF